MVHPGLVRHFSNLGKGVNAATRLVESRRTDDNGVPGRYRPKSRERSTIRMASQEIQTHSVANGLTLIIEPMADVQSAAFSLLVPAGSNYDPPGQAGAAAVLSDWIMRGAGTRDSRQ